MEAFVCSAYEFADAELFTLICLAIMAVSIVSFFFFHLAIFTYFASLTIIQTHQIHMIRVLSAIEHSCTEETQIFHSKQDKYISFYEYSLQSAFLHLSSFISTINNAETSE